MTKRMKKITKAWLNEISACESGVEWFIEQKETDPIALINIAIKSESEEYLDCCNWGIAKYFTNEEKVRYAINAAKKWLKNQTNENSAYANAAYADDYAGAAAADAAGAAAGAAADAAGAAANDAAEKSLKIKILRYAIRILKERE